MDKTRGVLPRIARIPFVAVRPSQATWALRGAISTTVLLHDLPARRVDDVDVVGVIIRSGGIPIDVVCVALCGGIPGGCGQVVRSAQAAKS